MGIATVREADRKYDAPPAMELPDPGELAGYESGTGAEESELVVTYFDTLDLRLFAAGITACRQIGGSDPGWQVKFPRGADLDREVLLPLGRGSHPPQELLRLVRVHTRDEPVEPIAELTIRRRRWRLCDPSAGPAVDVIDDHVTFNLMNSTPAPQVWHEVELKLVAGTDPAVLSDVERALNGIGLRPAPLSSRAERTLAVGLLTKISSADERAAHALVGRPRLRLRRSTRAGDVVMDYVGRQAEALRQYDSLVRCDTADAVHQMRVAARRMRSALQTYRRVLDPERTQELVAELRWLSGELSAARDCEVTASRLLTIFDALPPELALEGARAGVEQDMQRRERAAHEAMLAALNSDRYLNLQKAIDDLLADPPYGRHGRRKAVDELSLGVRSAYRRLEFAMGRVGSSPPGPEHEAAMHDARKKAKRLRYAAEVFEAVAGKPARRLQRRLRIVQDVLGDYQDTVVTRALLRQLHPHDDPRGTDEFAYGLLYGLELVRARQREQELSTAWARMRRTSPHEWRAP